MPFTNLFAPARATNFPPPYAADWAAAGVEPSLEDLLSDPVTHLVMKRDQVTMNEVIQTIAEARQRLNLDSATPGVPMVGLPPAPGPHTLHPTYM